MLMYLMMARDDYARGGALARFDAARNKDANTMLAVLHAFDDSVRYAVTMRRARSHALRRARYAAPD